jgi:hypothetical protein
MAPIAAGFLSDYAALFSIERSMSSDVWNRR